MTIGLVILGIVAVLIFFGAAERYFDMLGITSWLAFLIILAFVLGAVVPAFELGMFSVGVGGFIIPLIVTILLLAMTKKSGSIWRALPAIAAAAAVAAGFKLLMRPTGDDVLALSLITGFAAGALAFIIADSRINILIAAIAGITLGDIIGSSVTFAVTDAEMIYLGGSGVFDALIIAAAFGLVMYEAVAAFKKIRLSKTARADLSAEAAEDMALSVKDGELIMDTPKIKREESEDGSDKNALDYLDD